MSQVPPPPMPGSMPGPMFPSQPESGGSNGLAIAGLIVAILGFCLPPIGLIGLILGIVALAKARNAGRGFAIAAIVIGAVSLLMSLVMIGLLLPALGKARIAARDVKSAVAMEMIVRAMTVEQFDGVTDGAPDYNLEAQLQLDPMFWGSDLGVPPEAGTAYLLIAPTDPKVFQSLDPTIPILVENPNAFDRKTTLNVTYADGATQKIAREEALKILEQAAGRVYQSDGKPWKP